MDKGPQTDGTSALQLQPASHPKATELKVSSSDILSELRRLHNTLPVELVFEPKSGRPEVRIIFLSRTQIEEFITMSATDEDLHKGLVLYFSRITDRLLGENQESKSREADKKGVIQKRARDKLGKRGIDTAMERTFDRLLKRTEGTKIYRCREFEGEHIQVTGWMRERTLGILSTLNKIATPEQEGACKRGASEEQLKRMIVELELERDKLEGKLRLMTRLMADQDQAHEDDLVVLAADALEQVQMPAVESQSLQELASQIETEKEGLSRLRSQRQEICEMIRILEKAKGRVAEQIGDLRIFLSNLSEIQTAAPQLNAQLLIHLVGKPNIAAQVAVELMRDRALDNDPDGENAKKVAQARTMLLRLAEALKLA